MDPLSMTASIISILQLTEEVISYINTIRNASADQQSIRTEASSLYGLLATLRFRIEAARSDDRWFLEVKKLGAKNGPLDQFKSALESITGKVQPGSGASKAIRVFKWKFEKEKIQEALVRIERLKVFIGLALQNDSFSLSQEIHNDVVAITDGISKLQSSQAKESEDRICRWLNPPDPSSNHNAACGIKQAGTGSWFLRSEQYISWKTGPSSLLWAHGLVGCGKTVLSSTIIEDLLQHRQKNARSTVAYFYFDFNESAKRRHNDLLRSLVIQLSMHVPEALRRLEQLYSECQNGKMQPMDKALVAILAELLAGPDDVYIVLDALDECEQRDELIELIRTITEWHARPLHLLVTSRKERDIEHALESLATGKICIENDMVDADIQDYVRERLQHDKKFTKWPPGVRKEIEQAIMQDAHGMFRWAFCQLDSLRKCIKLNSLRKSLVSIPKTLNETYARILLNIPEDQRDDAQRIFQWLCYSVRPLRLAEMVEVLAIDLDTEAGFESEQRLPDPFDIVTICSSLVSIVRVTAVDGSDRGQKVDEVHLAHLSVQEYLLSDQLPATVMSHFHLSAGPAHAEIAQACLIYVLHLSGKYPLTQMIVDEYPLARYAAEQWIFHMRVDENVGISEKVNRLALKLLASEPENLVAWIQLFNPDHPWRELPQCLTEGPKRVAPPLHYSSLTGLLEVTRLLVENAAEVNAQGGFWGNALQAASVKGHKDIVDLLLKKDADVNAQGGFYDKALQAASVNGDKDIVELLLTKDADVNAQGGEYGNALQAASVNGHKDIVDLLLDKGAIPTHDDESPSSDSEDGSLSSDLVVSRT